MRKPNNKLIATVLATATVISMLSASFVFAASGDTTAASSAANPSGAKDILNVAFLDGTAKDLSSFNTPFDMKVNAKVAPDSALNNRNVLVLDGKSNVNYNINQEQLTDISDQFTLQAVFKLNSVKDQTIIENTQSSGIGFETNGSNKLELWARIGSSYASNAGTKLGYQLETGKYYDVVATYNGSEMALYVDGKLIDIIKGLSGKVTQDAAVPMTLGADPKPGGDVDTSTCMDGNIAYINVKDKGISADEVAANHQYLLSQLAGGTSSAASSSTPSSSSSEVSSSATSSSSSQVSSSTPSSSSSEVSSSSETPSSEPASDNESSSSKTANNPKTGSNSVGFALMLFMVSAGAVAATKLKK